MKDARGTFNPLLAPHAEPGAGRRRPHPGAKPWPSGARAPAAPHLGCAAHYPQQQKWERPHAWTSPPPPATIPPLSPCL